MAPLSQLDLSNVGKPAKGITNKNLIPESLRNPSLGVKAKAPIASAPKPTTTLPSNQVAKPVAYSAPAQPLEPKPTIPNLKGPRAEDIKMPKAPKETPQPTYGGIIGDLIRKANDTSAIDKANQELMKSKVQSSNMVRDIKSQAIPLEFQQGRAQVVQQAATEQQAALSQGVQNAITARGQDINALQQAGNLAAPQVGQYGQTFYDPLNQGASSMGGGNMNPVAAIPGYAQQVAGGSMSYDQAMAALGSNPAFAAELNAQIRAINPNFSAVQSNANAAVQGTTLQQTAQQSNALQLASQNAYKALSLLNESYNDLGALQKTPVPLMNKLTGFISANSGIGAADTQAYNTAIQEARAAVSQVLSAVGNTPSYSESTAQAIIPDNAGPDQIAAAIETVEQLIQQKVSSFANPGIAPQFGGGAPGGGGLFDW